MALIKCAECGKEISDTLKTCPNCGIEIKRKTDVTKENKKSNNIDIGVIILLSIYTICMLLSNPISVYNILNIAMLWLMFCTFKTKLPILKIITGIVLILHLIMYFFVGGFSFNLEYFGIFKMLLLFIDNNAIYILLYLIVLKGKDNGTN